MVLSKEYSDKWSKKVISSKVTRIEAETSVCVRYSLYLIRDDIARDDEGQGVERAMSVSNQQDQV